MAEIQTQFKDSSVLLTRSCEFIAVISPRENRNEQRVMQTSSLKSSTLADYSSSDSTYLKLNSEISEQEYDMPCVWNNIADTDQAQTNL